MIKKQTMLHISKKFTGVNGIVGLSGAGKSSLIKMMTGTLHSNTGVCTFGNVNIENISLHSLLSVARCYPQSPEIFDENIEYNITFGKKAVSKTEFETLCQEKEQALRAKHWNTALYQEIYEKLGIAYTESQKRTHTCECKKLPSLPAFAKFLISQDMYIQEKYAALCKSLGLENSTGRNLGTHGSNISGGEKNRIDLARFLLPEGAEFFILDGPFVNIDILSLKNCLEVFAKYKPCAALLFLMI